MNSSKVETRINIGSMQQSRRFMVLMLCALLLSNLSDGACRVAARSGPSSVLGGNQPLNVDRTDDVASASGCSDEVPDDCSLRGAIIRANDLSGNDIINLPAGTYLLTLEGRFEEQAITGDLDITDPLSVFGAGAANTIIDANTIDRAFHVTSNVGISGVTIRNGNHEGGGSQVNAGGAIRNHDALILRDVVISDSRSSAYGGGIHNHFGTLTIIDSKVTGNVSGQEGGGIQNFGGTLTVLNSTVSNNQSLGTESGGGISSNGSIGPGGPLYLENVTISDNISEHGGGLLNTSTATLINVTVSGNRAATSNNPTAGGIWHKSGAMSLTNVTIVENISLDDTDPSGGGGLVVGGSALDAIATVRNSIIAGNAGGNCRVIQADESSPNSFIVSNGYNMEDLHDCGFNSPGDLPNTNPLLGVLADNGGPTRTHALLSGSPAINVRDNVDCPGQDQRGVFRPEGGVCDIGAFEFIQPVATFTPSAGSMVNLAAVPEYILPPTGTGLTFPFEFFSWTVTGLSPGETITMTTTYPSAIATGAQYWKVSDGLWTNVTSLLGSNDGDDEFTLTITDGGLGDSDGMVNGQISDPGGLAGSVIETPAQVPFSEFEANARIELGPGVNDDYFVVTGTFTLGAGSNGIDPVAEYFMFRIDQLDITLAPRQFDTDKEGYFWFRGILGGRVFKADIRSLGGNRFEFTFVGTRWHLENVARPTPIELVIGNDGGTTIVFSQLNRPVRSC